MLANGACALPIQHGVGHWARTRQQLVMMTPAAAQGLMLMLQADWQARRCRCLLVVPALLQHIRARICDSPATAAAGQALLLLLVPPDVQARQCRMQPAACTRVGSCDGLNGTPGCTPSQHVQGWTVVLRCLWAGGEGHMECVRRCVKGQAPAT
jgi:hypothetical protein